MDISVGAIATLVIAWGAQLLHMRSKRRAEAATLTAADELLSQSRASDAARRQMLLNRLGADLRVVHGLWSQLDADQ
jgi:hypothetical protein